MAGIRLFLLTAVGIGALVSADVLGFPLLRTHGPYALYGFILPGKIVSCACLTTAILTERNFWSRILLGLGLSISVLSLGLVSMLILGDILFMNFPGPG